MSSLPAVTASALTSICPAIRRQSVLRPCTTWHCIEPPTHAPPPQRRQTLISQQHLSGSARKQNLSDSHQWQNRRSLVALAGRLSPLPRRGFLKGASQGVLGLLVGGGSLMEFPLAAIARVRAKTGEAEQILKDVDWPAEWPFLPENFTRYDESADTVFYSSPRFVTHIDDAAIRALTKYYEGVLPASNTPGVTVLDMCSSWISHYPKGYKQDKIVGLGLNGEELKRNEVLTDYVVQDLNVNPKLPFEDNSFDVITNVVSVDYLNKPLEVFKEMQRVLKPGGLAAMSFSNRCFWTKAIQIWTATGDVDHCYIVGAYFHYAGGFEPPQALDISPNPGRSDPMYVVFSRKLVA